MLLSPLAAVVLAASAAVPAPTTLAAAAPPAVVVANVPAPVTVTNTVRIPSLGNAPDGTLKTTVRYTDTTASATASTGDTIGLGKGHNFKLTTCVNWHRDGQTPIAYCSDRLVDTRANTATIYTFAPTVTLPDRPRPSGANRWGYFTGYTEVTYLSEGRYRMAAHSWPDGGLQQAGVPAARVGQTTGVLPPNQTVALDGAFTSAIDSGQPDSICRPLTGNASGPLPAGVTSSHPAFAGAPAYHEVGLPTGSFAGKAPRGVMLLIHGGGWISNGSGAVQGHRPVADRWRARGWETVSLTYRACGKSLVDALWFHDKARAWFGPGAALCTTGGSAGGHLALAVASQRAGVYCAISQAGPTDLNTIKDQKAYNAETGTADQTNGGRWVHNLGAAAFGLENLASHSPGAQVSPQLANTRVLQAFGVADPLVPYQQATDLHQTILAARPSAYSRTVQMAAGPVPFVHATVSQAAFDNYLARERAIVAPIVAPTVPLDRR